MFISEMNKRFQIANYKESISRAVVNSSLCLANPWYDVFHDETIEHPDTLIFKYLPVERARLLLHSRYRRLHFPYQRKDSLKQSMQQLVTIN